MMKKVIIFLLCLSALLPYAALCEASNQPIGNLDNTLGKIGVYCNKWNETIGASFKTDISFDHEKFSVVQTNFTVDMDESTPILYLWDVDGVLTKTNLDLDVFSMAVDVMDSSKDQYFILARVCAMVSAMACPYPSSSKDMTNRFINISGEYLDFFESNWADVLSGKTAVWEFFYPNGGYVFYLFRDGNSMYLSTADKLF